VMVGVTALTMYGPKLWEMAKGAKAAAGDLDALTDALVKGKQAATEEVNELDMLYKITQDTTKSIEDRRLAVDKLQILYPAYFKNIEDEKILNGEATSSYYALRNSIYEVAKAQALKGKLAEIINEGLEEEGRLLRELKKAQAAEEADRGKAITLRPGDAMSSKSQSTILNMSVSESDADRALRVANARAALAEFQANEQRKTALLREQIEQRMGIMLKYEETTGGDTSTSAIRRAGKNKTINEDLKNEADMWLARMRAANDADIVDENLLKEFAEYLQRVRKGQIEILQKMKDDPAINAQLEKEMGAFLMPTLDIGGAAVLNSELLGREDKKEADKEAAKKRKAELDAYINKLEEWLSVIQQFQSAVNDVMDGLAARANMQADMEIANVDRVEKSKLDSLSRLTLSDKDRAEQQKRIELEAETRRKKAEVERVTALRKFAVFQRGLDVLALTGTTTIAVMKAWAEGDPYTRGIRAAMAGATGLAQLFKLMATPLPQYKDGTLSKPTSGMALVSEEGRELIELPSGEKFLSPKTPTIMDLPARTRITPADATKKMMRDVLFNMDAAGNVKEGVDATHIAILDAFGELSTDVKDLKRIMAGKNLSVNLFGDMEHVRRVNQMFGQ